MFVYHISDDEDADQKRVGFSSPKIGDTILLTEIGKISQFNSRGNWIVRKDKPKESRVVGQRIWRWTQFRGRYGREEKERIVDMVRDCYPREFVPPPSLEMTVNVVNKKPRLVTCLPQNVKKDAILHAVNLYLEFFEECHLTDKPNEVPIVTPTKVNWRILPPGSSPWASAKSAVGARVAGISSDQQQIITERQRYICSFDPEEVYVGQGGFSDYLAYSFKSKKLTVLESVTSGNAIYVFDKNWRKMSQFTKMQILSGRLEKARVIHATGWHQRLASILQ